jgi:type 2 lantibiotic biosynthesis protein LanM
MDPIWYRALNLSERLATGRCSNVGGTGSDEALRAQGERLLGEWRAQSPFQQDEWFRSRLALDGIASEDELLSLLSESDEDRAGRCGEPAAWMVRLLKSFDRAAESPRRQSPPNRSPDFVSLVAPLAAESLSRVRAAAQRLAAEMPTPVFDAGRVAEVLYAEAAHSLDVMVSRVIALEMQVAKLRDELVGETPEERYRSFVDRLRDPRFSLAILRDYPVLARLAVELLDLWADVSIEFLERLCGDWSLLQAEMFDGQDLGKLESISGGAGDRHRGGRSVKLIRFTSGLGVAYKPRPLEIDIRFTELLAWLRERGAPELRLPKTLDRGAYGWSELIFHAPCSTTAELERFYHRQGAWLALLHILNAHDFHAENVIARGEHPMLIDLETLFRPELLGREEGRFESAADIEFAESVMQVMLLPFLHRRGEEQRVVEPSGLGGQEGQLTLLSGSAWQNKFTDEIRLVRRQVEIQTSLNRPRLDGETVDAFGFSRQIVDGFESMYRLLARHRAELLAAESPLQRCADSEVRVVLRPTQLYALLLSESFHPQLLGDALERDRLFDRLWFGIDRSSCPDLVRALIPSERADLWRGDIPYFSTRVDSHDAWSSDGERLAGLFPFSGLEVVRSRLEKLDERGVERQIWYIRSSLASLAWSPDRELPPPYRPVRVRRHAAEGDLLRKASEIGQRLESLAHLRGDEASWIGLTPVLARGWQLRPLRTDLYSGLPGVILFLAYLGDVTVREEPRRLAEKALKTLRKQMDWQTGEMGHIGGFSGWGGLLYTWTHLASLWRDPSILDEAAGLVQRLESALERNRDYDVSFGFAGAIVPLLGLREATGDPGVLDLARRLGDLLIRRASPVEGGLGWPIEALGNLAPTGFSHGAAGCAWALFELFAATGEERYREAALQAIVYENSQFSSAEDNWADLRYVHAGRPVQYMAAWCNGATGIGLSRLRILRHHHDPALLRDVGAAVRSTLRKGFGNNHCLCHGDLGSLELLLEASRDLGDPAWSQELSERTSRVFASIEENGWVCGLPLAVESPGFMEGIAGIGYGLLRLAFPDRLPSVLLLDPPAASISEPRYRERWMLHGKRLELRTADLGESRS